MCACTLRNRYSRKSFLKGLWKLGCVYIFCRRSRETSRCWFFRQISAANLLFLGARCGFVEVVGEEMFRRRAFLRSDDVGVLLYVSAYIVNYAFRTKYWHGKDAVLRCEWKYFGKSRRRKHCIRYTPRDVTNVLLRVYKQKISLKRAKKSVVNSCIYRGRG